MKNTIALAGCCALLTLTIGCSQPVVRANNNKDTWVKDQYRTIQGQYSVHPSVYGQQQGMIHGPMYVDGPAHQHHAGMNCPICPQPRMNDYWKPTHHHTWEYKAPTNLRYPPQNQPPAVIQYPYYTVKGPDDFFYEG